MHELRAKERRADEEDEFFTSNRLFSADDADALPGVQEDMVMKRVHGAVVRNGTEVPSLNGL